MRANRFRWFFLILTIGIGCVEARAQDAGTLRDARGEIMRGAPMILGRQLPESVEFAKTVESWTALQERGFNTVRICWVDPYYVDRDWPHWTLAEVLPHLDVVVQRAAETGMNLIINYHNVGEQNESEDFTLLAEFWEAVATRYANEENVYYEITNEPTFNGSRYLLPDFRTGLMQIYRQVRTDAPDRQVIMFSFNSLDHDMAGIVAEYAAEIDWSHTSIAYHMYNGNGVATTSAKVRELSRSYRLICTEWDYPGRWDYVPEVDGHAINSQTLESLGHSWIDWRDWGDTSYARLFDTAVADAREQGYWWGEYLDDPNPGHLSNLSARGYAGNGTEALIVGYVTRGPAEASMPILFRGVGPTLREAPFGVGDALRDPAVTVYAGQTAIDQNNDWGGDPVLADAFDRLGAFGFARNASADAATLAVASPTATNTVHVYPSTGSPGVALAELYDASAIPGSPANVVRLSNLSVRARVDGESGLLVGGFVVTGNVPRQVLLRGVGPPLTASFSVPGALADSVLRLYRADGTLLQGNDDWEGRQELSDVFTALGAFPYANAGSKDAALMLTLNPGAYTVHLSGGGGATGIGLIEVYEVP